MLINAVDQDSGEQEIWEHQHAFERHFTGLFQGGHHQWERDTTVSGHTPTKTFAFPQHPHDLCDIAIGIGVRRAATHNDKKRVMGAYLAMLRICRRHGFINALASSTHHFVIDAQFSAILNFQARVFRRIGVQDAWNVIFGMARSKQHTGNRDNLINAFIPQLV